MKIYIDHESEEKSFINRVLIARKLARVVHDKSLIYVLDSVNFQTTIALIDSGIDPKRVCVVERNRTVYKIMVRKRKGIAKISAIFVFLGDLFDVLCAHYCSEPIAPRFPRLPSERSLSLVPGKKRPSLSLFAIVADLMQPRLSDEQLNTLATVAAKTDLQHCFITLTARSPHGETVDKRIEIMREHRFGKVLPGLCFVYGYRRTKVVRSADGKLAARAGTVMITLGFSHKEDVDTWYHPRKVVPLKNGRVRVSWWGYPDPKSDTVEPCLPLYRKMIKKQRKRVEVTQQKENKEEVQEKAVLLSTGKRRSESEDAEGNVAKRPRRAVYRYPKSEPRKVV